MNKNHIAQASMLINALVSRVWDTIPKPELLKQYLSNTDVITGWNARSPIVYCGEYEGRQFADKIEFTVTQDNNADEKEKLQSEENWKAALAGLINMIEQ